MSFFIPDQILINSSFSSSDIAAIESIVNSNTSASISTFALSTTGISVNVSESAPPTASYVLTAVDDTHAIWAPSADTTKLPLAGGELTGTLVIDSNASSSIDFKGETSGTLSLKVPTNVTSHSLVLPTAQGASDYILSNNGSGVLSWVPTTSVALATTGASVNVSSAAAPTTGQIIKATSATTATWQNPSAITVPTFISTAWTAPDSTASNSGFLTVPASNYLDLQIKIIGSSTAACDWFLQFNGDTGSNYMSSANGNQNSSDNTRMYVGTSIQANSATGSYCEVVIKDYQNLFSTIFKRTYSHSSDQAGPAKVSTALHKSTDVLTSVKLIGGAAIYVGTTVLFYGIN